MNGGSSTASYSSENEITEDTTITSGSYSSTTKDENAIVINNDSFSSDSYIRIMDIISQNNIINHGDLL